MIIENRITIGSRVKITKDVKLSNRIFQKGHEFNVFDEGERGWDLIDDDGNKLCETRMIGKYIELVNNSTNKTESIHENLDAVAICLTEAKKHSLEIEVIYWALKAMKEDSSLTIEDAMNIGFNEWVK